MNKTVAFSILLFVLSINITPDLSAQSNGERVSISEPVVVKEGNQISLSYDTHIKDGKIKSDEMYVLNPILSSNLNPDEKRVLNQVVVAGKRRHKLLRRKIRFQNELPFDFETATILRRSNKKDQVISSTVTLSYESWMDDATLMIDALISGCHDCISKEWTVLLNDNILPQKDLLPYKVTFIEPEVEKVKTRKETHVASLSFETGKFDLRRNYKNNASKLLEIEAIVRKILNNNDVEVSEFSIHGYASPEGKTDWNHVLAENRANALTNYLISRFNLSEQKFTVQSFGEDWDGFKKMVEKSDLADKDAVLAIINQNIDSEQKNDELKQLSSGRTYQTLYTDFYPDLRRTEYTINYVVRPYGIDDAKEVLKKDPKHLSLYELYLVAETHPVGSPGFRKIYNIIGVLFPDNDIALINCAANEIIAQNPEKAIKLLSKIKEDPKSWNNLGVAYLLNNDLENAREYFSKSAADGDQDAIKNLEILDLNVK